jgi:hypothetical protein
VLALYEDTTREETQQMVRNRVVFDDRDRRKLSGEGKTPKTLGFKRKSTKFERTHNTYFRLLVQLRSNVIDLNISLGHIHNAAGADCGATECKESERESWKKMCVRIASSFRLFMKNKENEAKTNSVVNYKTITTERLREWIFTLKICRRMICKKK